MHSFLAAFVAATLAWPICTTTAQAAPSKPELVDVVVVGGGLSGLWAASELQRYSNLSVVVLEGRARVGGRTESTAPGHADTFDLGAHWVGSTQHHIQAVIKQLGKETYRQFHEGTKVMELGEGKVRHYKSTLPWLPVLEEINFGLFYMQADRLVKQTPRAAPYNASRARHFDGMTVESFCRAWPWSSSTKDLIAASMLTVMGKELADISALQLLHYAACAGGLTPLLDATKGGAQEFKIVGGTQALSIDLASKLDVRLNTTVVGISQAASSQGKATVQTLSGQTFVARQVIVAIPPHLAGSIWYDPPLPAKKAHLLAHMTQGHLIKAVISYERAFWRDHGFSGELVSSVFPLSICYDDVTPDGGVAALVCFIGGESAKRLSPALKEERQAAVVKALTRYFGPNASKVLGYTERDWGLEPFTGGCPTGSLNAGAITQWGDALREPHGLVHFGGTETATWFYGFMNGAVQAGERCAMEVLEASGLKVPPAMRKFYDMGGDTATSEDSSSDIVWA